MPYSINETCFNCGLCIPECPRDAISQGETRCEIDPRECIECGCCYMVCPRDAIDAPD